MTDGTCNLFRAAGCPWGRSVGARLLQVAAILAAMSLGSVEMHATVRAGTLSQEQAQLQTILHRRDYWIRRLKAAQDQRDALQRQVASIQDGLDNQGTMLATEQATFVQQKAKLDAEISWDMQRIAEVKARLEANWATTRVVRAQAERLFARLKALRAKIRLEVVSVRAAIVQLYDMGQVSPLEQLLEAGSLSDLLQQESFVSQIGERDTSILEEARANRIEVHRLLAGYVARLAHLSELHREEQAELQLVVTQTRSENGVLQQAQHLSDRREHSIQATSANLAKLKAIDAEQLVNVQAMVDFDTARTHHQLVAAERIAVRIAEQTGSFPDIGAGNIFDWGKLTHWEGAGTQWCSKFGGHPLGASFRHIYACGPSIGQPTPFDDIGFQCVELSARYLWSVNGDYVADVPTGEALVEYAHAQFAIPVGTSGTNSVPLPGDVVSIAGGATTPGVGHTAVVVATHVDESGDGAITIMEQNGSITGWNHITMSDWTPSYGGQITLTWLELFGKSN